MFAGGATTEAAQEVTGADIDALQGTGRQAAAPSWPRRWPRTPAVDARNRAENAGERLGADPNAPEIHERHCRHYLALAERAEPELFTRGEAVWLPRLDAEVENFRAALDWSLRHGDPTQGLRLAGLLGRFWDIRHGAPRGSSGSKRRSKRRATTPPSAIVPGAHLTHAFLAGNHDFLFDAQGLVWQKTRAQAVQALALSREAEESLTASRWALVALGLSSNRRESLPQRRRLALAEEAADLGTRSQETTSSWPLALGGAGAGAPSGARHYQRSNGQQRRCAS